MKNTKNIELLHEVACTVNHDCRGRFVEGETGRLDLIREKLEETDYKLTVIGLCHLYSKKPLTEIQGTVTVISSHVDTHRDITEPSSKIVDGKKLIGTYDNSITNAAVLELMLEGRLSDTVAVAFTGNEEYGMKGAYDLGGYLMEKGIQANLIVTDVTDRGYKGKNAVSLENRCHSGRWTDSVREALNDSEVKWKLAGNYEDDETCAYDGRGFECFSLCIPTKGEMHDNSGLKVRISAYNKYVDALCLAANI